jgi:hypothetical protein
MGYGSAELSVITRNYEFQKTNQEAQIAGIYPQGLTLNAKD